MSNRDEQILADSIDFLRSLFDFTKRAPKHAYPLSSLPYPKDDMKRLLKNYIIAFSRDQLNGSLEQALELRHIKGLYLMLADFMTDADAELVNRVWDAYSTSNEILGDDIEIISNNQENKLQTAEEQKKYTDAIARSASERDHMGREINSLVPLLSSINMLQTV